MTGPLMRSASYPHRTARIDVESVKLAHPVQAVLARYGVELRRRGRAAVGRCPFHADKGRPNLYVWGETASWYCFRCCVGGDVLRFVELSEGLSFREAAEHLVGADALVPKPVHRALPRPVPPAIQHSAGGSIERDPDELAMLRAATLLYHRRLLTEPRALAYVEQRGLDRATIDTWQLGYAAGDELIPFLRWRRMELSAALGVGLLDHRGQEFLAGRIVVPELRAGQPVWLAGRLLDWPDPTPTQDSEELPPKYLTLRGAKPLLGFGNVHGREAVIVVEGVFDVLTLLRWGYPAVALLGTHARPDIVEQLRAFHRVYLVLDQDDAGLEATLRLADTLGSAAIPVALPDGIKDVAELAPRADGLAVFSAALLEAVGALEPDPESPDVVTSCP